MKIVTCTHDRHAGPILDVFNEAIVHSHGAVRRQAAHGGVAASIALHQSLGFTHAGTIREAGFKFGRWLDLSFYQLILETPGQPRED